ncbi:M42 family peptidase [Neobacillus sp. YIM B02564]|uniref:M42 family peptidase n=1 Tax=Neobacillus paridis TaxID=2803862 RepID=A0ABS1TV85_9BACI|nr:M42 family peptidase [Neobacillus paridis]MBL4953790.1 M42 family peptidase [Neobacillus paridis]
MVLNDEKIYGTLKELIDLPGPVGHEYTVRNWLQNRWKDKVQEYMIDPVGNLICKIGGKGPKLLIQAHMDEIGFIVRYITPTGFILLDPVQEAHRTAPIHLHMIGQTAQVIDRKGVVATGIFAAPTGHILTNQQMGSNLDFNGFFVDLGVNTKEEVEKMGVRVGSSVIWNRKLSKIGNRYVGKAIDDRAGLLIMDLLLNNLNPEDLNYEVWLGTTVQEENKAHGAYALGEFMKFDLAIPLDIGLVGDIPTVNQQDYPNRLGAGPALVYKDGAIHYDTNLLWQLEDTAKENNIPYQIGIYSKYGSDGIAFYDRGIPSALVGIPTRYTHTAFEMVDNQDIKKTVELLKKFVERST